MKCESAAEQAALSHERNVNEAMSCSFDLDVLGGDVTLLPGLEAWLNSFIASTVLRCASMITRSCVYGLACTPNTTFKQATASCSIAGG